MALSAKGGREMLVCCADIRALDNARPLLAGRGGRAPSGFARSLLLVAALIETYVTPALLNLVL